MPARFQFCRVTARYLNLRLIGVTVFLFVHFLRVTVDILQIVGVAELHLPKLWGASAVAIFQGDSVVFESTINWGDSLCYMFVLLG